MSSFLRRHQMVITAVAAALLAIILYWPSLRLPVIYDSLLHIRISDDLTLNNVWLPTDKFGFYRPLTFLPLILIREFFGSYPNWLLHGLNVAQHGLNVLLLVTLAWRLWRNWTRAFVAGLLFALFPFSYQAIAVYGHNVHPTTTGLILLGLHTYLTALRRQKAKGASVHNSQFTIHNSQFTIHNSQFTIHNSQFTWWGVTAILFVLSLLSHESAILFGAFAALIHWNDKLSSCVMRHPSSVMRDTSCVIRHPSSFKMPPWLIFLLAGGVYAILYQFLPINVGPQGADGSGGAVWGRVLYLLQAAAYPFTWFAHLLPDVSAQWMVLGGTAVTILLVIWAARRRDNWCSLLLGWGWWGLASALIAIPLPTSYLIRGPRLLYLSSVGLALAWATILTRSQERDERKSSIINLQSLISSLFLAFILIANWQFVREKLADYAELTGPVEVVADVMAERPSSEGIITVNLPQWLAAPRNTYAVGGEFVAMLGNYLFADELIRANVGERALYPIVVADLLGDPAYHYGLHNEHNFREDAAAIPIPSDWNGAGSQIFIVRYPDEGLQTIHTGGFRQAAGSGAAARFGAYDLVAGDSSFCNGAAQVDLIWRQTAPVPPTVSIFVQLLAEDGRLMAQADGPPLGIRPDLLQMAPGWEISDHRILHPPEPGAPAQLLIGVYDYASGERIPAFDVQRVPLPDNAFRIPVTACSEP